MLKFLKENIDISHLSGFKTKAKTKYYFEINSKNDIAKISEIYKYCNNNKLKFLIIGDGTNCLFAFEKFEGVLIKNNYKGYNISSNILEVNSGENISDISEFLYNNNYKNLYPWIGLPGSIGGAIYGNAGCFGLRIEDVIIKAEILDIQDNKIFIIDKNFLNFSYRNSIFKNNPNKYFLIKVFFDLNIKKDISVSLDEVKYFRKNKQPSGNSCGSFFINPKGESAGKIIESIGLKGYSIGGAEISNTHANFIINNNGTYKDIINLKNYIIDKVYNKNKIKLKEEVNIIK